MQNRKLFFKLLNFFRERELISDRSGEGDIFVSFFTKTLKTAREYTEKSRVLREEMRDERGGEKKKEMGGFGIYRVSEKPK